MNVKYDTVIENFDPPNMYPPARLDTDRGDDEVLDGDIVFTNANASFGSGQEVIDLRLTIGAREQVAVFGTGSSGRTEILLLAAGLMDPATGRVEIGGKSLDGASEAVLGREIAYVGPSPYMFNDTIRGNVVYSLRHRPMSPAEIDEVEHNLRLSEAGTISTPAGKTWRAPASPISRISTSTFSTSSTAPASATTCSAWA